MLSTVVRINVLLWAEILATYALWMIMPYLTNVWKLNFTHAAGIVNVYWGIIISMPVANQFLIDTLLGNYWMLLLSSFAYCVGLGLLTMSTPPVLAGATGTCSAYEPECIGDDQKILFYIALALLAIGISGHLSSLGSFLVEQITARGMMEDLNDTSFALFFITHFATFILHLASVFALPYIKPWSIRFRIPAICAVVGTLVFVTGSCSYEHFKPQGSPLTTVFRVFVASLSKICYRHPRNYSALHEMPAYSYVDRLPYTRGLRCLDKAAIILPTQTLEQQQNNRWRLCRVTEVEETKMLLRIMPLCMTFIVVGIISSTGNSYFVEQANHLDRKVGRIAAPLPMLLWLYILGKSLFTKLYIALANCFCRSGARLYAPLFGIIVSMILAILCCITAAKVEGRRLDTVKKHGLIDKSDETIPMSMFWLLPQFVLIGGADGIAETSISLMLNEENSTSSTVYRYRALLGIAIFGIGFLGNVLLVFVVGKISGRGGRLSWFQDTITRVDWIIITGHWPH